MIAAIYARKPPDAAHVRADLADLAQGWRQILVSDPEEARPVISQLLVGRVTFSPIERYRWEMTGRGTLSGLFSREMFPSVWRPQRTLKKRITSCRSSETRAK